MKYFTGPSHGVRVLRSAKPQKLASLWKMFWDRMFRGYAVNFINTHGVRGSGTQSVKFSPNVDNFRVMNDGK